MILGKVFFIVGYNLFLIGASATTFNQTFIDAIKSSCPVVSHDVANNVSENIFNEIKIRIEVLQKAMNKILILNILDGCSSLNVPLINFLQNFNLSHFSLIQNTSNPSLTLYYISFLAYASNIYYLNQSHQELSSLNSSHNLEESSDVSIVKNLRKIIALILNTTCLFQLVTLLKVRLSSEQIMNPILNLSFELPDTVSLKQIKVCQIIKSTLTFLMQFNDYLMNNYSEN